MLDPGLPRCLNCGYDRVMHNRGARDSMRILLGDSAYNAMTLKHGTVCPRFVEPTWWNRLARWWRSR